MCVGGSGTVTGLTADSGGTTTGGTITLAGGTNVTTTRSGDTITIDASGSGTPGGSDTQVQFNDAGSFGGNSGLIFNKTTSQVTGTGTFLANSFAFTSLTGVVGTSASGVLTLQSAKPGTTSHYMTIDLAQPAYQTRPGHGDGALAKKIIFDSNVAYPTSDAYGADTASWVFNGGKLTLHGNHWTGIEAYTDSTNSPVELKISNDYGDWIMGTTGSTFSGGGALGYYIGFEGDSSPVTAYPLFIEALEGQRIVTSIDGTFAISSGIEEQWTGNDSSYYNYFTGSLTQAADINYILPATAPSTTSTNFPVTVSVTSTNSLVMSTTLPVSVAGGGLGTTTLTAYAPIFGGTTTTGVAQSGTNGIAGQVLTSNGASALPTFQNATGGGGLTVGGAITSGTANRVLYENASNNLAESADFTFTGATSQLAVTGTTTLTAKSNSATALSLAGLANQGDIPLMVTKNSAGVVTSSISPAGTFQQTGPDAQFYLNSTATTGYSYMTWNTNGDDYQMYAAGSGTSEPNTFVIWNVTDGNERLAFDGATNGNNRFSNNGTGTNVMDGGVQFGGTTTASKLDGNAGVFTLTSTANTNNEALSINLEGVANQATFSSTTGVNKADFSSITVVAPTGSFGTVTGTWAGNTLTTSVGGTGSAAGYALYSPIFAGTTSTSAFQSGSLGSAGHVLASNGPGALPTFQVSTASTITGSTLSQLPQATAATMDDLFLLTDDPNGTPTSKYITTSSLIGSGTRLIVFPVSSTIAPPTTTTGQNCAGDMSYQVGTDFNNYKITSVYASSSSATSTGSGAITLNIRNRTDAVNVLSTALTIDATERSSTSAATPAVINTSNQTVTTNDDICVQVTNAGSGSSGLQVTVGLTKT